MPQLPGTVDITQGEDTAAGTDTAFIATVFEGDSFLVELGDGATSRLYNVTADASENDELAFEPTFVEDSVTGATLWLLPTSPKRLTNLGWSIGVTELLARQNDAFVLRGNDRRITLDKVGAGDYAEVVYRQGGTDLFRHGLSGDNTWRLQYSDDGVWTDALTVGADGVLNDFTFDNTIQFKNDLGGIEWAQAGEGRGKFHLLIGRAGSVDGPGANPHIYLSYNIRPYGDGGFAGWPLDNDDDRGMLMGMEVDYRPGGEQWMEFYWQYQFGSGGNEYCRRPLMTMYNKETNLPIYFGTAAGAPNGFHWGWCDGEGNGEEKTIGKRLMSLTDTLFTIRNVPGASTYAFAVDTSVFADSKTGLRVRPAAEGGGVQLNVLSTGTHEALYIDGKGSGGVIVLNADSGGPILFPDGAVGSPGLSFTADQDTGLYRIGANDIALAVGGTRVLEVITSGVGIAPTTASTSSTTGALVVAGGAGIAGSAHVGGSIAATGKIGAGLSAASGLVKAIEARMPLSASQDEEIRVGAYSGSNFYGIAINSRLDGSGVPSQHVVTYDNGTRTTALTLSAAGMVGAGNLTWSPGSSVTPGTNGQVTVQATSNTSLTFKLKGSDGTVRSASLTLS